MNEKEIKKKKYNEENNIEEIIGMLSPIEKELIKHIEEGISDKDLQQKSGLEEIKVMRGIEWLSNKKIIRFDTLKKKIVKIDKNGLIAIKKGLPEKRLIELIKKGVTNLKDIFNKEKNKLLEKDEINVALGLLKKKGFIKIINGELILTENGKEFFNKETLEEKFLKRLEKENINLDELKPEEKYAFDNLLKRKEMISIIEDKKRIIKPEPLFFKIKKADLDKEIYDKLTIEDIKTGSWKKKNYRFFDIKSEVPFPKRGKKHFVREAINYIRNIWLELGFEEMNGPHIVNFFWDLDVLFVPQDHPAREMQDTFFIKNPSRIPIKENELFKKIKSTHENGWVTGSKGWEYKFSKEESEKVILRTHTTVLSAKTLFDISQGKKRIPGKYFSVRKVFRNEALDWKHLFEFYQVEGIVVDPKANFKHLIGYLELFFKKLGFEKIRIRPAHFPYTEPSVEVEGFDKEKNSWIELGGAGVFRPEVTIPLLGEEIPVLAWGLGMARTIKDYFNITDIRELYNNDLKRLNETKHWLK